MAKNSLGELRRSAVITTYAPGAVVDFRADGAPVSAVTAGLEVWDERAKPAGLANEQTIFEPRLQRKLGVQGFRLPPVVLDSKDTETTLIGVRFPQWLQCPGCHRLRPAQQWSTDIGKAFKYCATCTNQKPGQKKVFVVPVRFVSACEAGHLDEFPFDYWVNHKPECLTRGFLKLEAKGAGLAGLVLSCEKCGAARSMDGIFGKKALAGLSCTGKRPWLKTPDTGCGRDIRALQRGASNLYFPFVQSALSIPPWSDTLQNMLGQYWAPIMEADAKDRLALITLLTKSVLSHLGMSAEELHTTIEQRIDLLTHSGDLRHDEYPHFISGDTASNETEFELRVESVPEILEHLISRLVRVVRLREVRAISGFTRIHPPERAEDNTVIAPISEKKPNWYPAIEVRGEGIFVELDADAIGSWAAIKAVSERVSQINVAYRQLYIDRHKKEPKRTITPDYILLHSFAHALIRQLSLECGYSSSSLRERLYCDLDSNMSGVLVYTATADSDGTLGGLSRQGTSWRMQEIIPAAISSLTWCSSDPLCIEGIATMSEACNIAACHACMLVPETSCEEFNTLLDRATLVGTPSERSIGFFSSLT